MIMVIFLFKIRNKNKNYKYVVIDKCFVHNKEVFSKLRDSVKILINMHNIYSIYNK